MKTTQQLVLLFFILISLQTRAQSTKVVFLDKLEFITDSINASFKRVIVEEQSQLRFKDYRIGNGTLYQQGILSRDTLSGPLFTEQSIRYLKQGNCTTYYSNGQKMLSGPYVDNQRSGNFKAWYSNGSAKGEFIYQFPNMNFLADFQPFTIVNYYDSLGNQLVENGFGQYYEEIEISNEKGSGPVENGKKHGIWTGQYRYGFDSIDYKETYEYGKLISGESQNSVGEVTAYNEMNKQPEYEGGIANFYSFISKNMKYPRSARKQGIQGRVYVQFVVDKKGNTTEVQVRKGIGPKCDQQALEAVEAADNFQPGLVRGRPVKVQMMMPIIFNLNN